MITTLLMLQAAVAVAAAPVPDCKGAEHRQMDFWIGEWDVRQSSDGAPVGRSKIAPIFEGCALQETFQAADGFSGGSLNLWDRERREWVQFGTGSTGARRLFAGRWDGAKISLLSQQERRDASTLLIRMHLQPLPGGGVRQWSESSGDYGVSWRVRYDYTYRRAD